MGWIGEQFRKEWRVMQGAPISAAIFVGISFIVALVVCWVGMQWAYDRIIDRKNSIIEQQQATIRHFEIGAGSGQRPPAKSGGNKKPLPQPYVFAERGHVYHLDDESVLQGYVVIINSSKTKHAQISKWRVGVTISEQGPPKELEDFGIMTSQGGTASMRPGAVYPIFRNYRVLTTDETKKIRFGIMKIYVYGVVHYLDAEGQKYETIFCHVYFGVEQSPTFNGYLASQAKYCEDHNKTVAVIRSN